MSGGVRQFRLPDAGEGLTEAEVVAWRVAPGDVIEVNDVVVEIETAKALVELPSPYAGVVTDLLVEAGRTVPIGTPLLTVAETGDTGADTGDAGQPSVADATGGGEEARDGHGPDPAGPAEPAPVDGAAPPGGARREPMLVGYGPQDAAPVLEARRRRYHPRGSVTVPAGAAGTAGPRAYGRVLAKPPVRRLARDLGVDLSSLAPSGPGGVVTREDVLAGSRPVAGGEDAGPAAGRLLASPPVTPQDGDVRVAVRGVRRATAEAMVLSAFTAPHVTEWVQVDVSPTMEFVERMRADKEFVGLRVSPLLVVAKAVCLAARRNPGVNATWDDSAQEIVLRDRVNLGIAASTARGLVVPVIHDAGAMHMPRLAQELTDIVATAREGRLQPAQLTGGTVTITNVGVFGVDGGTPILPPGQAAILTMGQIRRMPWVVDDQVVARWVTTLSVSFDHRLVDGELGSSFLTDVAAVLADPARGLIWA